METGIASSHQEGLLNVVAMFFLRNKPYIKTSFVKVYIKTFLYGLERIFLQIHVISNPLSQSSNISVYTGM